MWGDLERFAVLPEWLRALADPEAIRAAFAREIPEFASSSLTLHDARLERSRNKKGIWNVYYRVTAGPRDEEPTEYSLHGVLYPPGSDGLADVSPAGTFGTAGWRGTLPDLGVALEMDFPDAQLPSFGLLTDPVQARAILERGMREHSPYGDIEIKACEPRVVRYKAGSRSTILYNLDYEESKRDPAWPNMVAVKTYYAHKGLNAWNGMRALWDSGLGDSDDVTIAEPLAFMPEMNVLIQGPVREDYSINDILIRALQLRDDTAMEQLRADLQATARGLAALHRSGVMYGEEVTWKDQIEEVRDIVGRVANAVPGMGEAPEPMLGRLEQLAEAHPAQPPLPCHRSFRPPQVLVHDGEVGFIDFDGFSHAEPALDVALFRATFKYIGLGEALPHGLDDLYSRDALGDRLAQLEPLCDLFLDEYEKHAEISRERVVLWETLYIFDYVLRCWTKVRPERIQGSMLMLDRQLRDRIERLG
jgi:hypothetical protein